MRDGEGSDKPPIEENAVTRFGEMGGVIKSKMFMP